ncbi:MAG TPA: hypothetical protein VGX23_28900 [Actinocrinis sp.]|nr:hypothetical protein [Actinocrinis sp.]
MTVRPAAAPGEDPAARRRPVRCALGTLGALSALILGLSGCGSAGLAPAAAASANPDAVSSAAPRPVPVAAAGRYPAGTALISDGTRTVRIGGHPVPFPTTVTDAAWSPDGSRIAFVDARGDVATAHPDGSGLTDLTTVAAGATRSGPSWFGGLILFTEHTAGGSRMESVSAAGDAGQAEQLICPALTAADGKPPDADDSSPSAALDPGRDLDDYGRLVYQRQSAGGAEIWAVGYSRAESAGLRVVDGSDPAISPDGSQVAFVDGQGQIEVASSEVPAGRLAPALVPVQVTFAAQSPSHLVWAPDGSRIGYSTAAGVFSVAARVPPNATANPPTQLSATPGAVTFLPPYVDQIDRFAGTDPVALSVSASRERWPSEPGYQASSSPNPAATATIGSCADPVGDLALLPGAAGNGPLLLTGGAALDPRVAAELHRVFGQVTDGQMPTVLLLGGLDRISANVETALHKLGYQTRRITSATTDPPTPTTQAAETPNSAHYRSMFVPQTRAVLVDSASPLDELVGTAFAGYYRVPVTDVAPTGLTAAQQAALGQGDGPATPTSLFGPATRFGDPFVLTLAGQDDGPLGCVLADDPADPVTP